MSKCSICNARCAILCASIQGDAKMADGDFEPEGWSAFDDHGAHGEKGNAGCAVFFIVIAVVAIVGKISGC